MNYINNPTGTFCCALGYTVVKLYPTEAEANAAYDELVNALRSQGRVFEV